MTAPNGPTRYMPAIQPSTANHKLQLPTSNCQPQTINYQPSTANYQPSTANHQLPNRNSPSSIPRSTPSLVAYYCQVKNGHHTMLHLGVRPAAAATASAPPATACAPPATACAPLAHSAGTLAVPGYAPGASRWPRTRLSGSAEHTAREHNTTEQGTLSTALKSSMTEQGTHSTARHSRAHAEHRTEQRAC